MTKTFDGVWVLQSLQKSRSHGFFKGKTMVYTRDLVVLVQYGLVVNDAMIQLSNGLLDYGQIEVSS